MRIIALLPVKNESWALPSYLSSITKIADQIIALNDSSTDLSRDILLSAGATVIDYDATGEQIVNMGKRRQRLLELGREAGGTHFIWLDADETFSTNFISNAREIISKLEPGQKISMRWVHAWKNTSDYLTDVKSPFGYIWKDFIVYDDGTSNFEAKFLSEARTPGPHSRMMRLPEGQGVVLHWQFSRWETTQYKQAIYRCTELVEGARNAFKINYTYRITLDNSNLQTQPMREIWLKDITIPDAAENSKKFLDELKELFKIYGIQFFEPLNIWHIPELNYLFIKNTGRKPIVKVFPGWLIYLNNLKIILMTKLSHTIKMKPGKTDLLSDNLSYLSHNAEYESTSDLKWTQERFKTYEANGTFSDLGFEKATVSASSTITKHIDIGSGGGWLLIKTAPFFKKVIGLEPSLAAIKISQQLTQLEQNIEYKNADMMKLGEVMNTEEPVFLTTSTVLSHINDMTVSSFLKIVNNASIGSVLYFGEPYGKNRQQHLWHIRSKEWWAKNLPNWELNFETLTTNEYYYGISGKCVGEKNVQTTHKMSALQKLFWFISGFKSYTKSFLRKLLVIVGVKK